MNGKCILLIDTINLMLVLNTGYHCIYCWSNEQKVPSVEPPLKDPNRLIGTGIFKKRPLLSKSINIGYFDYSMTAVGNRVLLVFFGYNKAY